MKCCLNIVAFYQRHFESLIWSNFVLLLDWQIFHLQAIVCSLSKTETFCSTLSFVGNHFVPLNSLVPIWCLELSLKQKQIHFFRAFFAHFLGNKKCNKKCTPSQSVWIKELRNNIRNFGLRNWFYLYNNWNFVIIFLRDFTAMDSQLKLVSR